MIAKWRFWKLSLAARQRSSENEYSFGVRAAGDLLSDPKYVVGGTLTTTPSFDCLTWMRSFAAVLSATDGFPALNAKT